MPMTGFAFCGLRLACAAPTTAPHAWLRTDLQMLFSPYNPPAHRIIMRSVEIRSGGMRCENEIVETTNFGTPSGKFAATSNARSVPMEPPRIKTPSALPSSCSCRASFAAPDAIKAIAEFSSPDAMIAGISVPAAAATSCLEYWGTILGSPRTETSMNAGNPPTLRKHPIIKSSSSDLVSPVPINNIFGDFISIS